MSTNGINSFEDDQYESDQRNEETNTTAESNRRRRKRNRKKKSKGNQLNNGGNRINGAEHETATEDENENEQIEIEIIPEKLALDSKDPHYFEFLKIFDRFKVDDGANKEDTLKTAALNGLEKSKDIERLKYKMLADEDEDNENKLKKEENNLDSSGQPRLSKKKLKKLTRLSVAELKQLVNRPDVVEMHDVTARDPKLLVNLKATRNTVPVPRHWCAKRKYLQGKRGIEKPAFDLPDFIKRTGITEMRQALHEKEENKSLKQKMREKVRPKMGKIDIDYQKLHDAFFRWQTKPKMSIHGDLYYEGKEFETKLKEKKPGNLTDDLRIALGMPTGTNADKVPPPWLIAMQRYGPPPSYPNLKIPGLNAPIPEGCSFGYHAGGWGKPPVDEFGRPLYGDVFGATVIDTRRSDEDENIDKAHWGILETEEIEEVEEEALVEESSEEELEKEEPTVEGIKTPAVGVTSGLRTPGEGLMTPSGISTTVSAGLETPDMIELRKKKIESDMEGAETPALFKVVPEKPVSIGASMMGSTKIYDLSAVKKVTTIETSGAISGIDVTLNPDELDMNTDIIQARYNQQVKEQQLGDKEDFSEMVADHAAKQSKKRKKQQQQQQQQQAQSINTQNKDQANKKLKEFKF